MQKLIAGIDYPLTKGKIVKYAKQKKIFANENVKNDLVELVQSFPSRTYRDSAEIAKALGEIKSNRKRVSSKVQDAEEQQQPSKKGGKVAVESSISASTIAKALSGIDFPKSKDEIQEYVKSRRTTTWLDNKKIKYIVGVLNSIELRKYHHMADVEEEIGRIL